jgi:hypothetical protein
MTIVIVTAIFLPAHLADPGAWSRSSLTGDAHMFMAR